MKIKLLLIISLVICIWFGRAIAGDITIHGQDGIGFGDVDRQGNVTIIKPNGGLIIGDIDRSGNIMLHDLNRGGMLHGNIDRDGSGVLFDTRPAPPPDDD